MHTVITVVHDNTRVDRSIHDFLGTGMIVVLVVLRCLILLVPHQPTRMVLEAVLAVIGLAADYVAVGDLWR